MQNATQPTAAPPAVSPAWAQQIPLPPADAPGPPPGLPPSPDPPAIQPPPDGETPLPGEVPRPPIGDPPGGAPMQLAREIGGPKGPEPTRFGDWEQKGRATDF